MGGCQREGSFGPECASGLLEAAKPLCGKDLGGPWTYLRGATALQGGLPVEADLQQSGAKAPLVSRSA